MTNADGVVDLLVIGGGAAGLVAARRAAAAGVDVLVLEAADRTGGMLRGATLGDEGLRIDIGAEAFATRGGAVRSLVEELGLGDEIVSPERSGSWGYADGAAYRMPAAGLLGIPANPRAPELVDALGAEGAARAVLDIGLPPTEGADARSLAELAQTRMGRAVLDRFVGPVARGVYSTDPEELDHRLLAPTLLDALAATGNLAAAVTSLRAAAPPGAAVEGVRGGMHRFAAALDASARALGAEVRVGVPVTALDHDPRAGHWRVVCADGGVIDARHVLVTVDPAGRIVIGGGCAAEVVATPTTGSEVIALLVDAPALDEAPRGTGVLVGSPAPDVRSKALTHVSAKWPWLRERLPAGHHVLRLSVASDGRDPLTPAEALANASRLLGTPIALEGLRGLARHEWRIPQPAARLGRSQQLARARERALALPGLDFAGTWIDGTGLATVLPRAESAVSALIGLDGATPRT